MLYRSRKDAWLVAVLATVAASLGIQFLWGVYQLLSPNGNALAGWSIVVISVVATIVILGLTWPLYYRITASEVSVRCGVLRWQLPLASIDEVSASTNPLSSPAMSIHRLRISYRRHGRRRVLLISPEDKPGFLSELVANDAGLELKDGKVVRPPN